MGGACFTLRTDGQVRQLAQEENFPGERVDAFWEDREGNIWAGVDRGGLVRVREKRFNVLAPPERVGGEGGGLGDGRCGGGDLGGHVWRRAAALVAQ
jgi:hypothetical protein